MTKPVVAAQCNCVPIHAPIPVAFQVHHVLPLSWNGPNIPSNKVTICGTCHDNVHHALDEVVRVAYKGDGTLTYEQLSTIVYQYTTYEQMLIARAVAAVQYKIPHIYTQTIDFGHDYPLGDEVTFVKGS